MVARPWSWPSCGSVGRLTDGAALPASSTTAAFMVVPPTSSPTNFSAPAIFINPETADRS